jgi:hypothetical protein
VGLAEVEHQELVVQVELVVWWTSSGGGTEHQELMVQVVRQEQMD